MANMGIDTATLTHIMFCVGHDVPRDKVFGENLYSKLPRCKSTARARVVRYRVSNATNDSVPILYGMFDE